MEKWETKLEKSGLENIEQPDGNLKLWSGHFFRSRFNATVFDAKEEYYRIAGQFLHDYPFEDKLEKEIWKLHAEGISLRKIVLVLKKRNFKIYKTSASKVVSRFSEMMMTQWQQKT